MMVYLKHFYYRFSYYNLVKEKKTRIHMWKGKKKKPRNILTTNI
jgi:hypothetical protein